MSAQTFAGHFLGPDTHSNRPSATGLPDSVMYYCTTHHKIERVVSGAWADYFSVGLAGVTDFNAQTGTSYTLVLTDSGITVTLTNAAAIALTVPTHASVAYATGATIVIGQRGAGQVTVAGAGGVTVNSRGSALKLAGQYAYATLIYIGSDVWDLTGDVTT